MGGCASRPKVLKGDEAEAPAPTPAPEPQKEEQRVKVVEEEVKKDETVVAEDENPNKNRSLGNLFKESEEGKDSAINETVKVSDVPQATPQQPEKTNSAEEPIPAPVAAEEAKLVKVENAETPLEEKFETPEEVTTEEAKSAVKVENAETLVEKPEEKIGTPVEKKVEEPAELAVKAEKHDVQEPEESKPAN